MVEENQLIRDQISKHIICIMKCCNEIHYFVQLTNGNKMEYKQVVVGT